MVLIVAIGIQLAQVIALVVAPGAIGLAIAFLGMPVLLALLLRRAWDVPWKTAIIISAIWFVADVALQVFVARISAPMDSPQ